MENVVENCNFQEKLVELVENAKEKFNVPSISVSVTVKDKDYFYSTGLSDVEEKIKATPSSIYAIASSSKAFIATSLCMLAEEGKLCLDDPVKKYLSDFAMFDEYMTENLTIRDALSHRTGLPRHDLTWYNAPKESTIYDTVAGLKYLPPAFKLRYRMHYQNHMFVLASVLTEKISGMSWQDFVKTRIFEPLGMINTYAEGNMIPEDNPSKARPYKEADGNYVKLPYVYLNNVGCCGSIYSTTEDLLKWAKFNLYGDERLLSNEFLEELHMPHTVIKPGDFSPTDLSPEVDLTSYGLGWFIESYRGHKTVHHGGTIDGFKSIVGMIPGKEIGFSVLSNLNKNQSPMALSYAIADALLGLEPVDWNSKLMVEVQKQKQMDVEKLEKAKELIESRQSKCETLDSYVGEYSHKAYGKLVFKKEDDSLKVTIVGQDVTLLYLGNEEFIPCVQTLAEFPTLCTPLYFEKDENDNVISVNIYFEEKLNTPIKFTK